MWGAKGGGNLQWRGTEICMSENCVFFLPVNILTVWCTGFLGHTTHYRVSWFSFSHYTAYCSISWSTLPFKLVYSAWHMDKTSKTSKSTILTLILVGCYYHCCVDTVVCMSVVIRICGILVTTIDYYPNSNGLRRWYQFWIHKQGSLYKNQFHSIVCNVV